MSARAEQVAAYLALEQRNRERRAAERQAQAECIHPIPQRVPYGEDMLRCQRCNWVMPISANARFVPETRF